MYQKIIIMFFLLNVNHLWAQNTAAIVKQLENMDLIKKNVSWETKDLNLPYLRLKAIEKIIEHSFNRYDEMAVKQLDVQQLKSKKDKGELLSNYEVNFLAKTKTINLSDTCTWLIQKISQYQVISEDVKNQIEILFRNGHINPADLLNAMHYLSAYEYLMLPKNLTFIIESFNRDKILTDSAKTHLLKQIGQNTKIEYEQIYTAYKGFRKLDIPILRTKKDLNTYLKDFISQISPVLLITDNQIITKKDSVYDYVYDEVKDTSIWGLSEVNDYNFFIFKYKGEQYKYPIYISFETEDKIDVTHFLMSDVFNTILFQVTADAKLPFHPVVFNIADDVKNIMYNDYERHLGRIIPTNRLSQFGVWNLEKDGATNFNYWLPDGRTINPKGLNIFDDVVTTANKYKILREAESLGFFEKLTPTELKDFKLKVMPILIAGGYNVISAVPNLLFTESASVCMSINFSNMDSYPKNYEQFLNKIVKQHLNNELVIKNLVIDITKLKNKKLLEIETEKGKYHFEYNDSDDECEVAFATLMEICEKENTLHKIYMNKVFKRNIFFITDRQAAYLNKKYDLQLVKIYK